jgi:hypothetical protein
VLPSCAFRSVRSQAASIQCLCVGKKEGSVVRLLNKLSKHHTSLSLAELASEAYDKLFEGVTKESIAEQLRLSPELCYLAFYVFQVTGILIFLLSAQSKDLHTYLLPPKELSRY